MNVIGPFRKWLRQRIHGPIGVLLECRFSDHAAAMLRSMGALRKPAASNIGLEYSVTRPPRHPLLLPTLAKLSFSDVTMRGLALTTRPLVPLVPLAGPDAAKPATYLKLARKTTPIFNISAHSGRHITTLLATICYTDRGRGWNMR